MADLKLLKKLRDQTKAPFKDCQEALENSKWDLDKAYEYLKEKGAMKAAKKADRETNQWIVKVISKDWKNVWIKLACETDFVGKSQEFHNLAEELLKVLFENLDFAESIEDIGSDVLENNINPLLKEYIWKIWENIKLLDVFVDKGNCFVYTHPWDKVIAIVYYSGWDFQESAKELALQIAAMNPDYINTEDIPDDIINKLKDKYREELKESWKPENVIDSIIQWKLSKYFAENVLFEQPYIRDDSKKVKDILPDWFVFEKSRRYSI